MGGGGHRSVFCGRDSQFDALKQAWARATAQANRHPQLILLTGDRGVGKTRLIQEFYAWLVAEQSAIPRSGYWPDELAQPLDNLRVHVDAGACKAEQPLSFVWWGMRLADPGATPDRVWSALKDGSRRLASHLRIIARKIQSDAKWHSGRLPPANPRIDVDTRGIEEFRQGKGNLFDLLDESAAQEHRDPAADDHAERDLIHRVIADLSRLGSGSLGAAIPLCIVIDDAQFSPSDPSAAPFFERLLGEAILFEWPVLIIVATGHEEWLASKQDPAFLAGALRRRHPEGERHWWRIVNMPSIPDLSPLLYANFPGIPAPQASSILARTAGNPRFLEEFMRHLREHPRYFVNRDVRAPLTEAGLQEALQRTFTLHGVVKARLMRAPPEVQSLLGLGGLQGTSFPADFTVDVARSLGFSATVAAFSEAERKHGFVARPDLQIAEFIGRVYHEAAKDHLRDLLDPAKAHAALTRATRLRLENDDEMAKLPPCEREHVLALAIDLFERAEDPALQRLALRALCERVALAAAARDRETALALARRLAPLIQQRANPRWLLGPARVLLSSDLNDDLALCEALALRCTELLREEKTELATILTMTQAAAIAAQAALKGGDIAAAERRARETLSIVREMARLQVSAEAKARAAAAAMLLGAILFKAGELNGAAEHYGSALEISRVLATSIQTPDNERALARAYERMGEIALAQRELDDIDQTWRDHAGTDGSSAAARSDAWKRVRTSAEHATFLELAEGFFRETLSIRERLAALPDGGIGDEELLPIVAKLATVAVARGDQTQAIKLFLKSLALAKRIRSARPTTQSELQIATFLNRLAEQVAENGDLPAAEEIYREAISIARRVAGALKTQEPLLIVIASLQSLGAIELRSGRTPSAKVLYDEALDAGLLLARVSASAQNERGIARSYIGLAHIAEAEGAVSHARELWRKAQHHIRSASDLAPSLEAFRLWNEAMSNIARLTRPQQGAA